LNGLTERQTKMKNHSTAISVPRVVKAKADEPILTSADQSATEEPSSPPTAGHNLFMMACCALMVAGVGIILATAPNSQSWSATLWAAFPLLACVGAHLVMHRFLGKSCHGSREASTKTEDSQ